MQKHKIKMIKVNSSNVDSVGYLKIKKAFDGDVIIKFKNGGIYQYKNVAKEVYEGLMASESIGMYLHQNIKKQHEYNKIDKDHMDSFRFIFESENKEDGGK